MLKHSPIWIVLLMLVATVGISQAQTKQGVQDIPEEAIGWVEGVAYAVAVKDNYAFVGFGSEFTVVDVSDKTAPVVVATLSLPGNIREIHLVKDVAFILLDMTGIWVVDITNPTVPTILNTYLEDNLLRIMVRDSYVYGLVDIYLKIWDITDPQNIELLTIFNPISPDLDWLEEFTLQGKVVFLMGIGISPSFGQTWGVDVSNPADPVEISAWQAGESSMSSLGRSLFYYYEYCTHYCTVWFSHWDVSNPAEPLSLGLHWMAPVYKSLFSYTMKGEGIYLYVGTDAAVFAYLPAQPAENGQVVMAYPLAHVRDLAVSQGYLWVASEQGLIIFEDLPRQKAFLPIHLR